MNIKLFFKVLLLGYFCLILISCELQSDSDFIIKTTDIEKLLKYLGDEDISIVALTLWHMESIDDQQAPDIFISLWEQDGKYNEYYSTNIEDNVLIKLVVASALIQYGYYFSEDNEKYILSQTSSSRIHVRAKATEVLASVGSVKAVEELYRLVLNDEVSRIAFDSLLMIAREEKRILDSDAILLARKYVKNIYSQRHLESNYLNNYIVKINPIEFENGVSDPYKEWEITYESLKVYPKTLRLLKPYSDNNDAYAKYIIGLKYLDGYEVNFDSQRGVDLLLDAAELGYTQAYYELAKRYSTGNGVIQDQRLALYYRELLSKSINR